MHAIRPQAAVERSPGTNLRLKPFITGITITSSKIILNMQTFTGRFERFWAARVKGPWRCDKRIRNGLSNKLTRMRLRTSRHGKECESKVETLKFHMFLADTAVISKKHQK